MSVCLSILILVFDEISVFFYQDCNTFDKGPQSSYNKT